MKDYNLLERELFVSELRKEFEVFNEIGRKINVMKAFNEIIHPLF